MSSRWTTALHEAGHAVVGLALDIQKRPLSAVAMADGAGYCELPDIGHRHTAVVCASGAFGAKLARIFPEPEPLPAAATTEPTTADAIRSAAVADMQHRATYKQARSGGDDCSRIDMYVVRLHPGKPCEWVRDRRRICAHSRLLVWRHRAAIRQAAIRLYRQGETIITKHDLQAHDVPA
jgi:hypothetical protein